MITYKRIPGLYYQADYWGIWDTCGDYRVKTKVKTGNWYQLYF